MYSAKQSVDDFKHLMGVSKFYCLKKEKVFRFSDEYGHVLKIPIDKEFYSEVKTFGSGTWQDKMYSASVKLNDGIVIITNTHNMPTVYNIK